jgi:hypothetical protein
MRRSLKQVRTLVDDLKLVSLNLTVAHAKLRLKDEAFQTVSSEMREMLDAANCISERVVELNQRVIGDFHSVEDGANLGEGLEVALDLIKSLAEKIIITVTAIKRGRSIDQRL